MMTRTVPNSLESFTYKLTRRHTGITFIGGGVSVGGGGDRISLSGA